MKSFPVKAGATIDGLVIEPALAGPKRGAVLGLVPVHSELYHTRMLKPVPIRDQIEMGRTG
jgi:hypothetical protein